MEKKKYPLFCFLICLIQFTSCAQKAEKCSLFYKAFGSNKNSDTATLVAALNEVLLRDSFCVDGLLTRGDILFNIDSIQPAKHDFSRVLYLDSSNVYAMYELGQLFNYEGKFDSSIYFFQMALDRKTIGDYFFDRPNKRLDPGAKYDVDATELLFAQGVAFYYKRDLRSALYNFNYTISNNYRLDKSHMYRAAIFIELRDKKNDPCPDLLEAKKNGSKEVDLDIAKYCKNLKG
jgi:tetratricopeptide (TPR) repeat protein